MILFSPGWLSGLLLLGAALVAAAARYRPRYIQGTAVGVTAVTLLLWLGLRTRLPVAPEPDALVGWAVNTWTWSLGGAWLILLLGSLLLAQNGAPSRFPKHGLILLVGGVTAVTLWAGTPALALTAWLLLALVWAAAAWLNWPPADRRAIRAPLGGLLLGALGLWYAAALGGGAGWATWPAAARTAALLAVFWQMGSAPLLGRRIITELADRETAVLLLLAPGLAGAALLLNLAATGPMPGLLWVTLAALLAVLAGLWRAWAHLGQPAQVGAALALTASGFVLLAGVWAGPDAAAAEGRVLALAVGLLFLAEPVRRELFADRNGWLTGGPQLLGWLLALAALAGLPLTAGFNGRAALYQAWLPAGGWALLLVTALLHVPLVTAVFLSGLIRQEQAAAETPDLSGRVGRLLLAISLLALPGLPLGEVAWVTWLALLLPVVAGLGLARVARDWAGWETAVWRQGGGPWPRLRQGARLAVGAVRDAAELLEGERGLLWLLLLAALIVLASSW